MDSHDVNRELPAAATNQASVATMAYWKGNAPDAVVSPIHDNAEHTIQPRTEAVESRRASDSSFISATSEQAIVGAPGLSTFEPIKKSVSDPMGGKNKQNEQTMVDRSGGTSTAQGRPSLAKDSSKNRTERPAYTQRTSTLMNGLRRGATYTQLQSNRHQYSYTFDPMSSDSESSSSSEDEAHVKQNKASKKDQNEEQSGWDSSEKQRRADAKAGKSYSRFKLSNPNVKTRGRISKNDGRLKISINETENSGYVAKALGKSLKHHLDIPHKHGHRYEDDHKDLQQAERIESQAESVASALRPKVPRPRLNIVIMVIGSRGDIQPFIRIGKLLQETGNHRVRLATHPAFKDFVSDSGLEFFSVGGNPSELMAFMVKNPGLIPNMSTIVEGEIGRRREQMAEMFEGFWRACVNSADDEHDPNNVHLMNDSNPIRLRLRTSILRNAWASLCT
jgi:hypothetical protein